MRYWENPASLSIRLAIIQHGWGEKVPDYLWYDLGDQHTISEEGTATIVREAFPDRKPGFGDIEVHKSATNKGAFVLRIRSATALKMSLFLNGAERHLYQFGHGDDAGKPTMGNFHKLWGDMKPVE